MEKSTDSNIIADISAFFETRPEVVAVYVFGSYASGRQLSGSDVDIGILFDEQVNVSYTDHMDHYIAQLSRICRKDIHPVVMNTAPEMLAEQILGQGRCIHEKDHKQLARYKMKMLSMILDFNYYKKMIQTGLVRKISGSSNG